MRSLVAAGGFLVAAAGFATLTRLGAHSPLWHMLLGAGLYAGGLVAALAVGSELIMGAVPPERAGAAAAVVETGSEFGGALGMAVLGSIGTAVYRSHVTASAPAGLAPHALAAARATLGGALSVATRLPGRTGATLVSAARDSFSQGLNAAALCAAALTVLAAALSLVFFRGVQVEPTDAVTHTQEHQATEEAANRPSNAIRNAG